ncbi:uncharacterized protein BJ212DRAFT_1478867 [Suillus subaureus]|uniref:Uncharacterized protein n=1 Tax=Suillus subaureus TaxID=48587 RepID=A0A9P7EF81_9AGAM|nr:uncharacterized protein BJ212DRAFT_1478867 [Suillus subaureus]KAG1819629.1 hypothetical protein BJ212DRAFT_1478867 [Suillus subaureus]
MPTSISSLLPNFFITPAPPATSTPATTASLTLQFAAPWTTSTFSVPAPYSPLKELLTPHSAFTTSKHVTAKIENSPILSISAVAVQMMYSVESEPKKECCIISHLSRTQSTSDSDDSWDREPNIKPVAIPGPSASKGDLMEALKVLQVQVQKLIEDNCTLHEENKVLIAEKPKHKCRAEAPDELLAHEQMITLYAHKYSMTVEMFPNAELLSKQCPENLTPFDN